VRTVIAGLETFAKVRALHDSTTSAGEKASAASRMRILARKVGLTVDQAVSKLDAELTVARNPFEELFNSPGARAARAERERRNAERRALALAEYGTEDAIWAVTEREIALELACRPVVVRKPIIGGEMDTLMGWDGGRLRDMPPEVREAVSHAYPLPATVREAWLELTDWEKLADDRYAFWNDYSPEVHTRARTAILEHLLDTLPATGMLDLRARLSWMQHVLDLEWHRDCQENQNCLNSLQADVERMGERMRRLDAAVVQNGRVDPYISEAPLRSTNLGTSNDAVQYGHIRRPTRAERHAMIRDLLADGHTDREVARRLGCSPTTVGVIRKAGFGS
jgi:hypothetical protein